MDEQCNEMEISPRNHSLLIYVIGCPGSGKGTLCNLLVQDYGCYHVSVGDLLRNLRDQNDQSLDIKDYIREGKLVPTATIVNIVKRAIIGKLGTYHAIIIDGFPRRLDQGIASEDQLGKPDLVLFFDCEKAVAKERYLTRKLEGRLDDNEEIFHQRYNEFGRLNPAIVDYYRDLGILLDIKTNDKTTVSYQNLIEMLKSNGKWM
ncbi:hypothetical protein OCU04_000218 [Sclerotinia nivalis]|uniref:Adenylate kinase n=1 Tax=Sclerotinia nivalis TaxID=352851 RepID=A0A9X0AVN0_9HELO|nr:hypothetical protein OCU04_000218 [Sclerotinia nivalis]